MANKVSPEIDGNPAVVERLLLLAAEARERTRGRIEFVDNQDANALLNDLEHYPHAYVLACLMDRQVKAERAWLLPWEFRNRFGSFEIEALARLAEAGVFDYMTRPSALHRLTKTMARTFHEGVQRIVTTYDGDAARIWAGTPPSVTIVRRFLEFRGAGPKIASMATNILVGLLGVPVSDRHSIDISADRHIQRVFARLGFVPEDADSDLIIYRARELSPEYPGAFDLLLWEVGRSTCRPRDPRCSSCVLTEICPSSLQ